MVALALLPSALSCSTSRAPDPEPTTPPNWREFDLGPVSGAVPPTWDAFLLTTSEFVALANEGLTFANASDRAIRSFETVAAGNPPDDEYALVLLSAAGIPNINVQMCVSGQQPVRNADGDEYAEFLSQEVGVDARNDEPINIAGTEFAVVTLNLFPDLDTYQVIFQRDECVSIATLTVSAASPLPRSDFDQTLALMEFN